MGDLSDTIEEACPNCTGTPNNQGEVQRGHQIRGCTGKGNIS